MKYSSNVQYPISAGGVVYRTNRGAKEFIICGKSQAGTWNLPKGTPEFGETIEETAIREVREETGLITKIRDYIGPIRYEFSNAAETVTFRKTVYFYLMEFVSGKTSNHDHEFDSVEWVSLQDALNKLTYGNEVTIVQEANTILA